MTLSLKDKDFYLKLLQLAGPSMLLVGWVIYWLTTGVSADTSATHTLLMDHIKSNSQQVAVLERIEKRLTTLCVNETVINGKDPSKCLE